jgi:hypothetical protein
MSNVTHATSLDQSVHGITLQFWNGVGLPTNLKIGCVAVQMDDNDLLAVVTFTCHENDHDLSAAKKVAADWERENRSCGDRVVVRTLPVRPAASPVVMLDAEEAAEWDYMMDAMMGD